MSMTPQQHARAKQLFTRALELESADVLAFVEAQSDGDAAVRQEVLSLLKYHDPQDRIGQAGKASGTGASLENEPYTDSLSRRARFSPGTIIAERYRIVARLGTGSMGEVYQADDLTLDQSVALKFLHPTLARQAGVVQRFRREVRLARQVTHTNVARVYDFVEAEGEAFISMEYIDGENLSSLLRRIGRLPADKVTDLARQLCDGLAAAHKVGVLHRDLKPGNIMLDGRGQVRITDFGIAALTAETQEAMMTPGTPAYMAPELFKGSEATVASDIYSLGLVLYEMTTGRQALPSDMVERRAVQRIKHEPADLVTQLEPRLNRAILECLHVYPEDRPESVMAVMGLLPGGDPLAQVLAAGQTPSPELVAQAGEDEGLRPWLAAVSYAIGLVFLVLVVILADRTFLVPRAGLVNSPQVLAHMANQLAAVLGYPETGGDEVYGFELNPQLERKSSSTDETAGSRSWLHDSGAIVFWLQRSDEPIIPASPLANSALDMREALAPGDLRIRLNGKGQLLWFVALPRSNRLVLSDYTWPTSTSGTSTADDDNDRGDVRDAADAWPLMSRLSTAMVSNATLSSGVDWAVVFGLAGLNVSDFVTVTPTVVPPMFADQVWAWEGSDPLNPDRLLRVEAATLDDQVVFFRQEAADGFSPTLSENDLVEQIASRVLGLFLFIMTLLGAVALGHRNMALGRIDYRGALRVSAYGAGVLLLAWAFLHRHVPAIEPAAEAVFYNLAMATFFGLMIWVYYIAFEPLVRRFWPQTIISWSRLIKGSVFDPLIGRDVLVGCVCGIGTVLLFQLDLLAQASMAGAAAVPMRLPYADSGAFFTLLGPGKMVGQIFAYQFVAIRAALLALMLMLLLRVSLRSKHLAAVAFFIVVAVSLTVLSSGHMYLPWVVNVIVALVLAALVIRGGVLQVIVALFVFFLLMNSPLTSQFGKWYAGPAMVALGLVAALLTFGFYTALAGRPVFRPRYTAAHL